jgi:hypothetical protein
MDWCFFQKPICRIRVSLGRAVDMMKAEKSAARALYNWLSVTKVGVTEADEEARVEFVKKNPKGWTSGPGARQLSFMMLSTAV